jgi:Protein required for attachment to host cells
MKETLVVVTDLAGFKAFRLNTDYWQRTPRLELFQEFGNAKAHERLIEKVTDLAGRFPRSDSALHAAGAMADGERHNIERELRKRYVRQLAGRLNSLLRGAERCYLAASRKMNRQLWDELESQARAKIEMNVPADLTKVSKSDLLRHFNLAARPGAVAKAVLPERQLQFRSRPVSSRP